jgi:hypothetical protein
MAYSLDTKDLGKIQSERVTVEPGVVVVPGAYNEDSTNAIVYQLDGPIRRISITGLFTGSTAEIQAFISNINLLTQAGNQTATVEYISDINGTLNVLVNDFNYTYFSGKVEYLEYSISLVEGTL